jgi:hypothetical protein
MKTLFFVLFWRTRDSGQPRTQAVLNMYDKDYVQATIMNMSFTCAHRISETN